MLLMGHKQLVSHVDATHHRTLPLNLHSALLPECDRACRVSQETVAKLYKELQEFDWVAASQVSLRILFTVCLTVQKQVHGQPQILKQHCKCYQPGPSLHLMSCFYRIWCARQLA